jgi:hypothetical protein
MALQIRRTNRGYFDGNGISGRRPRPIGKLVPNYGMRESALTGNARNRRKLHATQKGEAGLGTRSSAGYTVNTLPPQQGTEDKGRRQQPGWAPNRCALCAGAGCAVMVVFRPPVKVIISPNLLFLCSLQSKRAIGALTPAVGSGVRNKSTPGFYW